MTVPNVPILPNLPAPSPVSLRPVQHPDLSEFLWHFCSRSRMSTASVPDYIKIMSAANRLESILWEGLIRAFTPYTGPDPVVSFTEVTANGATYVVRDKFYQPWALIFARQSVYDAGGGPVWHVRDDVLGGFGGHNSSLLSWTVRLGQQSDWLEEREWRIVRPNSLPGVPNGVGLHEIKLVGLLVGDKNWTGVRLDPQLAAATGQDPSIPFYPRGLQGVYRGYWNPESGEIEELPPLY